MDRNRVVAEAMADIRQIEADHGVTRQSVEAIRDRLIEMASHRDAFDPAEFPMPGSGDDKSSFLYRLSEDNDGRFALYAQRSAGAVSTPAHNHTTWACVVGFEGRELNRFYSRTGDATGVHETHEYMVEAGTGVAMLPDDLHSIHIDSPALNFHCYGLSLEQLDEREYWNPVEGVWKFFSATSGIVDARAADAADQLSNC